MVFNHITQFQFFNFWTLFYYKLAHLGLGFFEDINIPIYKGGFVLPFTRAEDNDAIYRSKSDRSDTIPDEGKITIDEFIIRVHIIEFKSTSQIELINELECLNAAVPVIAGR